MSECDLSFINIASLSSRGFPILAVATGRTITEIDPPFHCDSSAKEPPGPGIRDARSRRCLETQALLFASAGSAILAPLLSPRIYQSFCALNREKNFHPERMRLILMRKHDEQNKLELLRQLKIAEVFAGVNAQIFGKSMDQR
jgi:hypothetical protein